MALSSRPSRPRGGRHKYQLLEQPIHSSPQQQAWNRNNFVLAVLLVVLAAIVVFLVSRPFSSSMPKFCDTVDSGYQCLPEISHFWGQYSPFFGVPSVIATGVPAGCEITFAQMLSRHGARDPTFAKSNAYNQTVQKIRSNVKKYPSGYEFLANYEYKLGADQLTIFGEQQMINSGIKFYQHYQQLAMSSTPFIRSSGQTRVVESARYWAQGFHDRKTADSDDSAYPYSIIAIPENDEFNNTLSHGLCGNFEHGPASDIGAKAQAKWTKVFVPPIQSRLNSALLGASLTVQDTIYMMDLCPFSTVSSVNGTISSFCYLFTEKEWHDYAYYQTLGKYYSNGYGNPLGPTQGVGFVNELVARLTNQSIRDETSTNHTLDSDPTTFPLGLQLYADFSHDTDMTSIFSAMGLYNGSSALPNTTLVEAPQAKGYSAAWTVPFAARAYFEKMHCGSHPEELVRVIVNDRVLPLTQCGGDGLGRCALSAFVDSLGFAIDNGHWDQCFR